ncbi:hypothetical protein NDU88_011129 [Pleurodeles waltl]|uniref:Uncharacterized protein n=1 Tax=Pleurodeles waltl TaxID=8319 RepID=A0AAV7Q279_PLEWA|nr:hypothetical protein NDU88_011129 [Pleurodeles waltl]
MTGARVLGEACNRILPPLPPTGPPSRGIRFSIILTLCSHRGRDPLRHQQYQVDLENILRNPRRAHAENETNNPHHHGIQIFFGKRKCVCFFLASWHSEMTRTEGSFKRLDAVGVEFLAPENRPRSRRVSAPMLLQGSWAT